MFRLSRAAEYAIRGVLHLSMQPDNRVTYIEEIASSTDVPKAYLAKIFQTLARKGYLVSSRGQGGGFALVKKAEEITPLEIIEAIEGTVYLNDCLIREGYCDREKICPVHDIWNEAQNKFYGVLKGTNFKELATAGAKKQKTGLKLLRGGSS